MKIKITTKLINDLTTEEIDEYIDTLIEAEFLPDIAKEHFKDKKYFMYGTQRKDCWVETTIEEVK